jgi:hypothetical protein
LQSEHDILRSDEIKIQAPVCMETNANLIIPSELTTRIESSCTDIILLMWCAIPKVTNKTAPILMNQINLLDLICLTDTTEICNKISNMSFPSGMRIGPSRAESICSIAYEGSDVRLINETRDSHVRILSQIPMVSIETADIILSKISMKVLCRMIKSLSRPDPNETAKNLRTVVNQLSVIAKRNNSKLGLAIAQKIVDILIATPIMSELLHLNT